MASSGQSSAPPTPLWEQFANSVPHILASLKALEEQISAQQLEIDRLKLENLSLKGSVPHDGDRERENQRVRHFHELQRLAENCTLVAQRMNLLKEIESLEKLEMDALEHDLDVSNEKLKMALTELQEQKRIVAEGENFRRKLHDTIMANTLQVGSPGLQRTITKRGQPASAPGVKRTAGKTLHLAMKNLQLDRPAQ